MTDQDLVTDTRVGVILYSGLVLSIAVMVLGLVLSYLGTRQDVSHVLPMADVPSHVLRGDAPGILDLGILLLFATPLLGVGRAMMEFVRRRDLPFAFVVVALLGFVAIGFVVALR